MLNCQWAAALTRYHCQPVNGLHGEAGLEIATPFAAPNGCPVTLYLMPLHDHVLISDNGDTLFAIGGDGLNVYNGNRLAALRRIAEDFDVTLTEDGDFRTLATPETASFAFARCTAALLAVCRWAEIQLNKAPHKVDLLAEIEPFIIARQPLETLHRNWKVEGASNTRYVFDFKQGTDLIDVITPRAVTTGMTMRKIGDVLNGPFLEGLSPLVVVDDRFDPVRAFPEMQIISSICRVQPVTALMATKH